MRFSLFVVAVLTVAVFGESLGLGPNGLSGWPGLPASDILSVSSLRAGASIEYLDTDNGTILSMPLRGCWGAMENVELAAVVPVIPLDDAFEGSILGDVTLAGGWLYERTRGGTTLKLTGRLTLPTGEEYRDRGTELAFGGVTSTTFLDFRLSMSGEYALNGGRNPFDDQISDVFYFNGGGSSYITSEVLLSAALNGSTSGVFQAVTSVQMIIAENLAADAGFTIGLHDFENFGFQGGIYWTETGF